MEPTTPVELEVRLIRLSKALDDAYTELEEAEYEYHETKTKFEIGMAGARIALGGQAERMTVQEKEDRALLANKEFATALSYVEARVKAARANTNKLRAQVDIVRSMNATMRAALDL